jgi:excisionase family DNA binding protein
MNTMKTKAPRRVTRHPIKGRPEVPLRFSRKDLDDFLATLPPEFQGDGEEMWAEWASQNEEMAWIIASSLAEQATRTTGQAAKAKKTRPESHSGDPMLEPKLSVVEAAKFLSIGSTRLREIVNDGEIPFVRMGGKYLFFERDLAKYIRDRYMVSKGRAEQKPKRPALPDHVRNSPLLMKG